VLLFLSSVVSSCCKLWSTCSNKSGCFHKRCTHYVESSVTLISVGEPGMSFRQAASGFPPMTTGMVSFLGGAVCFPAFGPPVSPRSSAGDGKTDLGDMLPGVANILVVGADSFGDRSAVQALVIAMTSLLVQPCTEPRWRLAACTGPRKTERHARSRWEQELGCMAGCAQHKVA
jgi:hypothetical protein